MRVLLCLVLLTAGTVALASDLVGPLRTGNHTELERVGKQEGAAGLAFDLASGDRVPTLAALRASLGAKDSWALLGMLAQKAGEPDRSVAMRAAAVGVEIVHELDGLTIEFNEVSNQDLLSWHSAWLAVAQHPRRWVDIRIYALEVAEQLRRVLPASKQTAIPWQAFFSDEDAEMRAAAIALAPRNAELEPLALQLLQSDALPQVALSAGQWLCGPLGSRSSSPAMDASTLLRLQTLATNRSLDVALRVDLANCLLAEGSEASRRALALLLQQSPPALRRALLALTQQAPAP